ncbi:MAG TPA: FixH family protein [Thermomicrobiales bacterium]|jgi:hypothetical protein
MANANPTNHNLSKRLGLTAAVLAGLILAAWFALPAAQRATLGAGETPTATPTCPRLTDTNGTPATPVDLGTPTAAVVCSETGLGTPVAADGLWITVTAAQSKAGPVDLTIGVADDTGAPVDDATVLVLNQHLEMNHGVSVNEAAHTASGRYLAKQVPMGMGGHWQVEVQISRPDQPVVAAVFEVTLTGPM